MGAARSAPAQDDQSLGLEQLPQQMLQQTPPQNQRHQVSVQQQPPPPPAAHSLPRRSPSARHSLPNSGASNPLPIPFVEDFTVGKLLGDEFNDDDQFDGAAGSGGLSADAQPEPEVNSAEAAILSVKTRVEYSALPRGTRQDVFGLVTVAAAEASEAPEPSAAVGETGGREPMDIVCVLDVSGSMGGEKIRLLQEAMRFVIDQAQEKDRVSIVTFNHSAARHLRLRRMAPEGKSEATVAALRLVANGGTNIAAGLDVGVSVMERRRSRNKVSAIMLLTDGQDSGSRAQIPELLSRCREANCSLYAFGFGKDHDAALLSSIAEQAMTPFTFVEEVKNIREAFAGTVGGLSSVVAQSIELSLSCRVALKTVHTPFVVRRTSDRNATVLIPDIFAGESRDVLVELDVPMEAVTEEDAGASSSAQPATEQKEKALSGMVLLEAHVKYTDLRRNVLVQTAAVTMATERFDEPQPELEPDEEVTAQRERVEVARALREAAEQSDRLDFDGARRVLDSQASALRAKKKATRMSPALLVELEDASSRMSSRSAWEQGGRAEVKDSMQMHMMQRCTNMSPSASSPVPKFSKDIYCSRSARSNIRKLG